jgi:hypothetical protein
VLISSVHFTTKYVQKLSLLRCDKHLPNEFDEIFHVEFNQKDGVQRESGTIDNAIARYVKVRIDSGFEEFSAVYSVQIEGKPVQ